MVGREVEFVRRSRVAPAGRSVLSVKGITTARDPAGRHATALQGISLEVRAGEVLGFAGLIGAGRTELARIIFGADRCEHGVLYLNGRELRPLGSPAAALAAGLALVPEDAKTARAVSPAAIGCAEHDAAQFKGARVLAVFVDERRERELVEDYRRALDIKMAGPRAGRSQPCRAATSKKSCWPALRLARCVRRS